MTSRSTVAVVGAGFAGVTAAVRLQQDGVDDVVLFERAAAVGGCWRDNTYPGAACDVPSHLYSLSFAPKHDWSRRFAPQAEILAYLREVADRFGVTPKVRLQTEVRSATWDEERAVWVLALSDGSTHEAQVLVPAVGQLSTPSIPALPGLETFEGTAFHSAQWRHDHDLSGERVAVVGTGASAIQFVPRIAPVTASLTLFQREAAHVLRKPDRPYARPTTRLGQRLDRWRIYWQNETRTAAFRDPRVMRLLVARFESHLRLQVRHPETRSRLRPRTSLGCKRILIANDYYPALQLPHVSVVESAVAEVRPRSVVDADGREHPVDTIVFGTGFRTTEPLADLRVQGRHGRLLSDAWADGAEAHLGMVVHGFPNLFLLYGPGTNLAHSSILLMLEAQADYLVQAVRVLRNGERRWLEVRAAAQQASNAALQKRLARTVWASSCTSWYKTASGRITTNWSGSVTSYRLAVRRLRLADYEAVPLRERIAA